MDGEARIECYLSAKIFGNGCLCESQYGKKMQEDNDDRQKFKTRAYQCWPGPEDRGGSSTGEAEYGEKKNQRKGKEKGSSDSI